jgi:hypothetical protein
MTDITDDQLEVSEDAGGVPAADLSDEDLLQDLAHLHETRHEAFMHAPTAALQHHSERTAELELEFLRRHPQRSIKPRDASQDQA